ncbi:PREDICTED: LOW QUALITY PROTEIN: C-type lectin domain family 1 member A [Lipotes vexillifer]|uniref:LOW QUALITY PROTEIN: C-type lectin domain family 1 member A n=1 Tax=Lipotes vexillifer TaxID=118797 RepID=A0A340Y7C1_LIPVE|nr:PREDICTED: LOW QUALITY PROTEIN: C-type lectin domain family 1 member A [Lipotes vexillifer]
MLAKYSSTRDMLEADGDTTMSLHSRASTATQRPEPGHTEHRCSPCPEKWKWHGDKCYQFYEESKSWQGCEYFCIAENSTMLKINTQEVLEFAMPQSYSEFFYSYWTGLSRNGNDKAWLWMDGAPYSHELFEIIIDFTSLRSRDCVTILNGKAFSKDCRELRRCACERAAATVKLQRLHEPLSRTWRPMVLQLQLQLQAPFREVEDFCSAEQKFSDDLLQVLP